MSMQHDMRHVAQPELPRSDKGTKFEWVILLKLQVRFRCIAALLLVTTAVPGFAQGTLTIGVQSTLPSFQLTSGTTATNNLTVTTNWNYPFLSGHWLSGTMNICVYMTSPMTGTGTNTDTIAASNVRVNGSSIVTGSTNCGVASAFPVVTNAGISLFGSTPATRTQNGSRSDPVGISISGYAANLEPDTYTGTINLIVTVQ